jgi:hypothetical protein
MSVSRAPSAASVAANDAPLINKRAGAAQRKVAVSTPVRRGVISSPSSFANRIGRREPRRVGGRSTDGSAYAKNHYPAHASNAALPKETG